MSTSYNSVHQLKPLISLLALAQVANSTMVQEIHLPKVLNASPATSYTLVEIPLWFKLLIKSVKTPQLSK